MKAGYTVDAPTATLSVNANVTVLNAALAAVVYDPPAAFTGNVSLHVSVTDNGSYGSGGALVSNATVTLMMQELRRMCLRLCTVVLLTNPSQNRWSRCA